MDAPHQNWKLFRQTWEDRVVASDASWNSGLTPTDRLTVTDDLFDTIRSARLATNDWQQVDECAWQDALAERLRMVEAFRRFDEAQRGITSPRDAG
ncbi:MAG: hypothetical protein NTY87_11205 [Planctomycetia bacterium]|nr:hypothetical protein [Planctomycetia bacterium]